MPNRVLTVCRDSDELADRAADLFLSSAVEAVAARGRFTVALAGGSTPEKTYTRIAQPERRRRLDWAASSFFFGDERLVPYDDPRSNFGMARRTLLHDTPAPQDVLPIPTDRPAPECAAAYAATLARSFGIPQGGHPPRFDLILLGLGDDGHTASLFPGAEALRVRDAWVTATPPGTLPPPVERITLTFPVLEAARRVVFLVAGANKACAVHAVLEGGATPETHPAAGVAPAEGTVTWLLDGSAAGLLARRS
jgi:6-phosphogluconolactonase